MRPHRRYNHTVSLYEIIVIGGGINGLGIAADAAARGLSVLLVEKGDLGGGTTSTSSRLIHGGLRYLQYGELSLVHESLRERGLLARQRPHLVRPIQLLIPTYRGLEPPRWKLAAGLTLYNVLARDPLFPAPAVLSPHRTREREPGLSAERLTGGFLYPDGQVEFPERLCVELARAVGEGGGEVRTYSQVTGLLCEGSAVVGVAVRDMLTGEEWEARAPLVINAAGPWVDAVNRLLRTPPPRLIGGTWGTHVVLPLRPEGPRGPLYSSARKDGRPFFILPWDGRLLVGTTDVRFEGDPGQLQVQDWEVEYLLDETNLLFPGCGYTPADVQYTTIGVRPLPASDQSAGAITRRHFLVDHGVKHGIPGLASIVGGKLTTYRSLAEEAMDFAVRQVRGAEAHLPCTTRNLPPGPDLAALEQEARRALAALRLPAEGAPRLARLYGARFSEVLELVSRQPELAQPLYTGGTALRAEAVYTIQREGARTVEDVLLRRLMLLPPPEAAKRAVADVFDSGRGVEGCRLEG